MKILRKLKKEILELVELEGFEGDFDYEMEGKEFNLKFTGVMPCREMETHDVDGATFQMPVGDVLFPSSIAVTELEILDTKYGINIKIDLSEGQIGSLISEFIIKNCSNV